MFFRPLTHFKRVVSAVASVAASVSTVTANLVLSLDAATMSGGGTTWTDSVSSKAFTLYGNGRASPTQVTYPTYNSANGGYLSFNSTNRQFIKSATSLASLSSYTAEGWMYITSHTTNGIYCLITEAGTAAGNFNYTLGITGASGNNLTGGHYKAVGGWYIGGTSAVTSNTGAWKYLSVTYDGTTRATNFYINGSLVGVQVTQSSNTAVAGGSGIHIGTRWDPVNQDTAANFLEGRIAVIRIYSNALTSTQVLQNYNAQRSRFGL